jgi:hypothetical protein
MALDTLTLKELQQKRQAVKNQLASVKGPEAEAVKTELEDVEDMIRIRQDSQLSAPPPNAAEPLAPATRPSSSQTDPEKIYFFLKGRKGKSFCDDCVAKETAVDRHDVNTITSTLALFPAEFRRLKTSCDHCALKEKLSTQAR